MTETIMSFPNHELVWIRLLSEINRKMIRKTDLDSNNVVQNNRQIIEQRIFLKIANIEEMDR
jgi:hypothetical protein